jgi:hypothetical protein
VTTSLFNDYKYAFSHTYLSNHPHPHQLLYQMGRYRGKKTRKEKEKRGLIEGK